MTEHYSSILPRVAIVALAATAIGGCGVNSVPKAEEVAKAKWADVQAAFQERANLFANLAAVAKGAGVLEKSTQVDVTNARSKASSIQLNPGDLSDPAKMKAFQDAQAQLAGGLGRLLVSVEAYPDLKANQSYLMLQSQVEGSENRIRITIKDYNEAVRAYNTTIRTFPDAIGAKVIYGAKPMVPYEAVTPGANVAPSLDGKV